VEEGDHGPNDAAHPRFIPAPAGISRAVPLFRRRRPDPPEWASFFDADAWHAFAELVRYEAGRRGWSQDLAAGFVGEPDAPKGLANVAQLCHASLRDEWTAIVAQHFAGLEELGEGPQFANAHEARAALKVRLIDDDFLPAGGIELAQRRIAEDLRLVLAFDLPTSVMLPPRSDVLAWGDEDELFEIALEQTRAEGGALLERHDFDEDRGGPTSIWVFHGESFFTATHAIWGVHLDPSPERGMLVAVPNRHTVLAHPIRDLSVVSAVSVMLGVTNVMWAEGPGSLSDGLYWLRDGTLERLPAHIRDGNATFVPPDEFVEVLNGLDEPGPGGDPPGPRNG
jgi:hypothetical protein